MSGSSAKALAKPTLFLIPPESSEGNLKKESTLIPTDSRSPYTFSSTSSSFKSVNSVIGKATGSQAIASLFEVNTGLIRLNLYDRSSLDFVNKIAQDINKHDSFKSLLVDNGSENSKLDLLLDKNKLYSCDPYSSWQKAEIESMHRLIRLFWPKGKSMNSLTQSAVKLIERKVNLYFRKRYNKYANYRYRLTSVI